MFEPQHIDLGGNGSTVLELVAIENGKCFEIAS